MQKLTAADLVAQISRLDNNRWYLYPSGISQLKITKIVEPEGPIKFVSINLKKEDAKERSGSISSSQLARIASAFSNKPDYPIHIDRVFSASSNSRSALETLLAYTPHFYICYLQRADVYTGETSDKKLKHIMWRPSEAHALGQIVKEKEYRQVITEIELGVDFGHIQLSPNQLSNEFDSIEAKRTHTQMQIALIEIGNALGFQTWIAKNDRSIEVGESKLGSLFGVVQSLEEIPILYKPEIRDSASLVDCIWFADNGDRIPAIIEIEHSTGVTSGLTRMKKLKDTFPSISATFAVVAPNELRNKVITEANQKVFRDLRARYMPYSTIRELYGLMQRYSFSGLVDHSFINAFMERVVEE